MNFLKTVHKNSFVNFMFNFLIIILANNVQFVRLSEMQQTTVPSSLKILYIEPADLNANVFELNEKDTLGNHYKQGWILPSEETVSLNLYLFYDAPNETKILPFLKSNLVNDSLNFQSNNNPNANANNNNNNNNNNNHSLSQRSIAVSAPPLYLFFTASLDCSDYKTQSSWNFELAEKLDANVYAAHLSVKLPYSDRPLHICMQQFDVDDNLHDSMRFYAHQGTDYWLSIVTTRSLLPTWLRICSFFMLLSLSGLFSGLNLGLMSLDLNELETLQRIGTPKEQSYAAKIYPLRKRGNFLLCTILLGNVLVNSVSTLLLGDMLSGVYAALGSTILIVIFGEIIPQAACSKHGLAVGANTRYIMYIFMALTSPLSFPLSIILDKLLGQEIAATYNREKLRELMMNVDDLDDKEKKIITGALDFNKKKVREIMTKLEEVFMLEISSRLDFEAIARIAQEGYSRIPVYQGHKEEVVGLLHVKDFTLLDPDDNMPVRALLEFYNHSVIKCDAEKPIDEMFEEFRKGETHLAFVTDVFQYEDRDPVEKCVGIVTLEDILEELVQMEIYDEFDDKKEIEMEEKKQESTLKKTNSSNSQQDERKSIDSNRSMHEETTLLNKNNKNSKQLLSNDSSSSLKNAANANNTQQITLNATSSSSSSSAEAAPKPSHSDSQTAPKDLSFFLQQQKDSSQRALISPQVRFVMFQFLFTTVKPFTSEFLTKNVLELLFKRAIIKESRHTDSKQPVEYLYKYGKGCSYFILILSGEATIEVGQEKLEFPAGPFAYFGVNALLCGRDSPEQVIQEEHSLSNSNANENTSHGASLLYVPDFSLRIDDRCVYLKIDRDLWRNGVIKSNYERLNNRISDSIDYIPSLVEAAVGLDHQSYQQEALGNSNQKTTNSSQALNHLHTPLRNVRRSTFAPDLLTKVFSNSSNTKTNLKNENNTHLRKSDIILELKNRNSSETKSLLNEAESCSPGVEKTTNSTISLTT